MTAHATNHIMRRLSQLGNCNPAESAKLLKAICEIDGPQKRRDKGLLDGMEQRLGKNRYDPPYDSPIEDRVAWELCKHLDDDVTMHKQYECKTRLATFKVDLVAEKADGRKIGFECDGHDYHLNYRRDDCRDALILGTQAVAAIFRFPGGVIYNATPVCLLLASRYASWLFTKRSLEVIRAAAWQAASAYFGERVNAGKDNEENREEYVADFLKQSHRFTINTISKMRKNREVKKFIEMARKDPDRPFWNYRFCAPKEQA